MCNTTTNNGNALLKAEIVYRVGWVSQLLDLSLNATATQTHTPNGAHNGQSYTMCMHQKFLAMLMSKGEIAALTLKTDEFTSFILIKSLQLDIDRYTNTMTCGNNRFTRMRQVTQKDHQCRIINIF